MKAFRRQSGFVILMVLVVLVVAGTILTAAARRSCQLALEAGRAQRELQVHWGARSCEKVFLAQADQLLHGNEAIEGSLSSSTRRTVTLGGVEFDVFISDEQAKANANTLSARKGGPGLEESLRRLGSGGRLGLPVRLVARGSQSVNAGKYGSLDELFVFDSPADLMEDDGEGGFEPGFVASRVTCWSDGKVNFKRSDPAVLREVFDGILTENQIYKLTRFRESSPDCLMSEALKPLELTSAQLEEVKKLLTDKSSCQSVWVIAKGQTRNW